MRHPGRTRVIGAAVVAAALVGALALVVSGGSEGHRRSPLVLSAAPSSSSKSPAGDSGSTPGSTAPGSVGGASSSGPAPNHQASAATTSPVHQPAPTASAAPAPAGHPSAPPAPPAAAAAAPGEATTGTYRYRQTNPATPASEGTLVVGASTPGTQTWTRNFGTNVPVSTSVMSYRSGGIFTIAQSEVLNGSTVSCSFAAPVPAPPSPATVGRTFSGQATCTGQATLSVTGSIESNALLTVDGAPVNTAVVGSHLVLAVTYQGTPFEADLTQVDWYAPNVRMPVQSATHLVVPALSITSDSTYVLESSKPS